MWIKVHIYSVAGNTWVKHNDNIKRAKLQNAQLEILRIYAFCWKIQQRMLGESAAGVT